jgi:chromosome segregation ATPase
MEVLKRLENKIHALVAHRNQLMEELARTKELLAGRENEIRQMRGDLESAQSKAEAMTKERDEVKTQIESVVEQLVGQLEAEK